MGSQVFTANGSWNWPTGVTSVTVEVVGGGGGGGDAQGNPSAGGGGRGGGYAKKTITKGAESSLTVNIGAGGTTGVAGGATTIVQGGSTVCSGQGGGSGTTISANSTYGAGATSTNGSAIGDTTFAGGNGGTALSTVSGAGGGAGGPSSAGGNATNGTAGTRGTGTWGDGSTTRNSAGAAGQTSAASAGIAGGNYGGGGSGGRATNNPNQSGGAGSAGVALFVWVDQSAPVVVLNSPADGSSDSDTTPTLDFTGTDADGDSIEYNVLIDTVNTFDSSITPSVADSYSETNVNTSTFSGGGTGKKGQSFTGDGKQLQSVQISLSKSVTSGNPAGSVYVEIYAHSGTYGSTGIPTGAVLATSDVIDVSTLTTTLELTTLTFSGANKITLANGTRYFWVILFPTNTGTGGGLNVGLDNTSPTHAGNYAIFISSWGADNFSDIPFYINTGTGVPLIDKVSTTDAGFVNPDTGGDTHPFNSGENIQYTVQSALSVGTYYWKVRGIDPTGGNAYGSFSSVRSFTVTSGGSAPNSGFLQFM